MKLIAPLQPPSELVVASALHAGLPGLFAVCVSVPGHKKIVDTYRRYDASEERERRAA